MPRRFTASSTAAREVILGGRGLADESVHVSRGQFDEVDVLRHPRRAHHAGGQRAGEEVMDPEAVEALHHVFQQFRL